MSWILVFLGGGLGSVLRFGVSMLFAPSNRSIPFATLAVNVLGCFVLGYFLYSDWALARAGAYRAGIATGVLGGFTTFSTFGVESIRLYESDQLTIAILYIMLSLFGGLAAAYLGMRFATSAM